jgi:hypothetical protein
MDEAKRRALDLAAQRYDEAKKRARVAAIEAEDLWAQMFALAGDDFDALEDSLKRLFERRGE